MSIARNPSDPSSGGHQRPETEAEAIAPVNGTSYLRGCPHPPLVEVTIPQLLSQAVSRFGQREALVFSERGIRMSYEDLDHAVNEVASGLLALGLNRGERVGIWSPNRPEWVLTQFATARVGLVLVNINPAYRPAELEYVLNKVGCRALVSARRFRKSDYLAMLREVAPELDHCTPGQLQAAGIPQLRNVIVIDDGSCAGAHSFEQLRELGRSERKSSLPEIDGTIGPDDSINIQFTSGTTGLPKGATLSHRNVVNNARYVTDRINLTETDRLAIPVPLYHCFGMVMGVLGAVSKGAAMIFPGEGFDAEQTLDVLESERCTAVYGVPTMFVAMLENLERKARNLSGLRTGIMAGAPCPVEVMRRVMSEMNMAEVTICYGMTETSPVSFQSFVDDPIDKRCETVGRVHPHLEVKLVDDDGRTVPVGQKGELCTRGYAVMKGYWDDEKRTSESIVDGWMHSGDLAVFDNDGFCSIVGRVKDMIIRGGENIFPREIEEQLIRHPKVSSAQVFGVPDERFGEEVCAWAIAKPEVELAEHELRNYLTGRIAHFKIPRHIRVVEEIPMTITGKPQKFVMRERMAELLSRQRPGRSRHE